MKSIHEVHIGWVEKLKERGETVLQPKHGKPMGHIDGYIKTQHPHTDAGCIFQDKHGTFGLFGDMGALHITGIKWEDLGLCDSRCWYEWMDPESYQPKPEVKDVFEQQLEQFIANLTETKKENPGIEEYLAGQESGYQLALLTYRDFKRREYQSSMRR